MKKEYPELPMQDMLSLLQTNYKQSNEVFKRTLLLKNVTKQDAFSDDESEEEYLHKSGDYFEMTCSNESVSSDVGSGPILVRFSYSNSSQGIKIPFPPIRVKNQQQVDHIEALVNHQSSEYVRKLSKTAREKILVLNTDVSLAECNLPKEIVKHIKSCFTKSQIESFKPGRRTHKGVKKCEKFVPAVKNVIPYEEELFIPPSGPSSTSKAFPPNIDDSLESYAEPREYFLRSLLPKLNAPNKEKEFLVETQLQHVIVPGIDDEVVQNDLNISTYNDEQDLNLVTQEPEKIVDIESLRKKRIYDDENDEDEESLPPKEEEYLEALETTVFGDKLTKVIPNKAPRKGISERETGRGGRNEFIRKKLKDEQYQKGIDYLLGAANPFFEGPIDKPDFVKIFKPKKQKQNLKIEDLEEDEDEDFKVPGVRKAEDGDERRSRRLGKKKQKQESGEYYKDEILVKLSEEKDMKPIEKKSVVEECDEILNHFNF